MIGEAYEGIIVGTEITFLKGSTDGDQITRHKYKDGRWRLLSLGDYSLLQIKRVLALTLGSSRAVWPYFPCFSQA